MFCTPLDVPNVALPAGEPPPAPPVGELEPGIDAPIAGADGADCWARALLPIKVRASINRMLLFISLSPFHSKPLLY